MKIVPGCVVESSRNCFTFFMVFSIGFSCGVAVYPSDGIIVQSTDRE